ncbi:serum albumin-like [Pantherophis guttatus]|uniref:Serum albumin-like n=1 Tax=Pantherophis guttatus TaxID=94885 RepID=A0A6P9CGQ0_PANGU|nr:serum albumin-like [Pantherophis guttatus]
MKWVIFVSLLCFLSFAELKNLRRQYRHTDDHHWTISLASQIPTYDFGAIALGLFAQSIPNATLEEVQKLTANVKAIHQKCVDNEYSSSECTKPLGIVFLDVLCHDEEFSKTYGINDCCAKADPERNECVLSHKISSIGSVSSFVHPSAEEACQAYHNNRNAVLAHHLYEISRRNPTALIIVLSAATKSFDKILETCCEEVEKDTCIQKKAEEVRKKARKIIDEQENTCFNLNNYGKETLYALKFIETAEKFINANLEIITHIAKDIVHIHEETCKGDSLEATLDRAALSQYICEHKDAISSNLDHCCGETLVERPHCIVTLENDARSPDLPPPSGEILKETEACTSYRENATEYKESFLFALISNHPELSKLIDLEILHRYEELLEKCCKLDDHVECLHTGEEEIKLYITKINDVVKNNCDRYEDTGRQFFQIVYLAKYSKIIPQAPNYYLIEFSKKVAKVAEKCCKLDSDHQVSCALENVDKVIGSLCRYHKEHFTNKQVCHCCGSSFINRWECISNLGPDPSHVPPPFKPKALDAPENLCSPNEETMQNSRQGLLIDLIKSKPNIIEKEIAYGMLFFQELQTSCCAADNEEECSDILQRVKSWLNRVVI